MRYLKHLPPVRKRSSDIPSLYLNNSEIQHAFIHVGHFILFEHNTRYTSNVRKLILSSSIDLSKVYTTLSVYIYILIEYILAPCPLLPSYYMVKSVLLDTDHLILACTSRFLYHCRSGGGGIGLTIDQVNKLAIDVNNMCVGCWATGNSKWVLILTPFYDNMSCSVGQWTVDSFSFF